MRGKKAMDEVEQNRLRVQGIAQQRTERILRCLVVQQWSMQRALIAAYLAGVEDGLTPLSLLSECKKGQEIEHDDHNC